MVLFGLDVLNERSHYNTTEVIKRLGQGIVIDFSPLCSIDSVAECCADQVEPNILGKAGGSLDMVRGDEVYRGMLPKFLDREQIAIYAGIVYSC